ncbi:Cell wall / vacuolar inhibitor of fructosidase 1 [Sesamum alatum]|uniref:Cell wall / vacuolar inhibitor of fructosidase 1 n=1 Tax=Sesamum alatum TaxID=300844 RepID=A0AAE1YP70_9LAMI|nr:Cell wall / vacuolar inhibitor of fructosidase 1 [Sesamum alatum]
MMKFLISVILLIIMVVQTYAASPSQNSKDTSLVVNTCKNTPHYRLCLAVLRRSPKSATADVRGLALIAVGAVKTEAERAMDAIKKLRKEQGQGKGVAAALKQCAEVYDAVLEGDVEEAEEGLKLGDPKFAENGMADAAVEADSCEDAFAGVGKSPLSRVNSAVHDIAEVARAIIRNLL